MAEASRWDGRLGPKQWLPLAAVLSLAIIGLSVLLALNLSDDSGGNPAASSGNGRVPTHEHADFLLFIRGQKFDFNQPGLVSHAEAEVQSGNVHIHDFRYTVVHVHTTLTTWDEFFTSIGFTLTDPSFPGIDSPRTCLTLPDKQKLCNTATETWKFIANGVQVDGMSNVNMSDLSRVLFSYGPETVEQVISQQWTQMTDEACILSELCIARIKPDEPPEECQGAGQCAK